MMPRVLVTDGEQRSALAVVRSLGRAGYETYVCSTRERCLAGASRYARASRTAPDPLSEPDAFAAEVRRMLDALAIDVLIPITEPALLALLPLRDRLGGVRLPFPELATFQRVSDKQAVTTVATQIGIATPRQRVLDSAACARAVRDLEFPVVLKPSRSVGETGGERRKVGVRYAANEAEFLRQVESMPTQAFPLLVQQRVVGPGIGIFFLTWGGERVAVFSHRRIREKPPAGGVSVYCESIPADPRLVEPSEQLIDRLGWQGVAMVEYKFDTATDTPYLMEVNGRFWGSLQLAVDAGVDFPRLLVEAALGRRPAPVTSYRAGVRSRWWWGDVDHLLARLRRTPEELALPADAPGRWRVAQEFLKLWQPGDRSEVFRRDDPRPFARETLDWLAGR